MKKSYSRNEVKNFSVDLLKAYNVFLCQEFTSDKIMRPLLGYMLKKTSILTMKFIKKTKGNFEDDIESGSVEGPS